MYLVNEKVWHECKSNTSTLKFLFIVRITHNFYTFSLTTTRLIYPLKSPYACALLIDMIAIIYFCWYGYCDDFISVGLFLIISHLFSSTISKRSNFIAHTWIGMFPSTKTKIQYMKTNNWILGYHYLIIHIPTLEYLVTMTYTWIHGYYYLYLNTWLPLLILEYLVTYSSISLTQSISTVIFSMHTLPIW